MQDSGTQSLIIIGRLQLAIFVAQLFVFGYQALKLRETVKAGADQSRDMKNSIAQATRAADAMETFAHNSSIAATAAKESVATMKDTMTRQLRAYVCVILLQQVFRIQRQVLNLKSG